MPENPLVTEIVNSKKAGDSRQEGLLPVGGAKKNGNERSLPVIAVDDVRHEIRCFYRLQDSPRKKDKTLGIVYKITILRAVEIIPVIVLVLFHEIDGDAVVSALGDLALYHPMRDGDRDPAGRDR